jgi:hypothetical protein
MGSGYDPYTSQHVLSFGEFKIPTVWYLEMFCITWSGIGLSSAARHWQTQELGFYERLATYSTGGMLLAITIVGLLVLGGV